MKRFIGLILIVVGVGILWYLAHRAGTVSVTSPTGTSTAAFHPDPADATFTFDGDRIRLRNGSAEAAVSPGSQITNTYTLTDSAAYGDLNGDGKEDAAVLIAQTNGVSGANSVFVAVYVSGPVSYAGTNALNVGDQIIPKSVSIAGSTITVTYLDRSPTEPLDAEPTILMKKMFVYSPLTHSLAEQ